MSAALFPLAQGQGGSGVTTLIFLVLMFVLFYFLLIRPQQRRARQQRQLLESLEIGDEVMTIGGMFGTITAMDDEAVTVQVAPGVDIRMVKSAIARKLVLNEEGDGVEEQDESQEEEEAGGPK